MNTSKWKQSKKATKYYGIHGWFVSWLTFGQELILELSFQILYKAPFSLRHILRAVFEKTLKKSQFSTMRPSILSHLLSYVKAKKLRGGMRVINQNYNLGHFWRENSNIWKSCDTKTMYPNASVCVSRCIRLANLKIISLFWLLSNTVILITVFEN